MVIFIEQQCLRISHIQILSMTAIKRCFFNVLWLLWINEIFIWAEPDQFIITKHVLGLIHRWKINESWYLKWRGWITLLEVTECYPHYVGQIPMRHLVYRVQPLPQSLLPLVWDFGTLQSHGSNGNIEKEYISRIIQKYLVKVVVCKSCSIQIMTIYNGCAVCGTFNICWTTSVRCSHGWMR